MRCESDITSGPHSSIAQHPVGLHSAALRSAQNACVCQTMKHPERRVSGGEGCGDGKDISCEPHSSIAQHLVGLHSAALRSAQNACVSETVKHPATRAPDAKRRTGRERSVAKSKDAGCVNETAYAIRLHPEMC